MDTDLIPWNGPSDDKPKDSMPVEITEDGEGNSNDKGEQSSINHPYALEDADIGGAAKP